MVDSYFRDRSRLVLVIPCSARFVIDTCADTRYGIIMLKTFRHKGLKRLFEEDDQSGVRTDQVVRIRDVLRSTQERPLSASKWPASAEPMFTCGWANSPCRCPSCSAMKPWAALSYSALGLIRIGEALRSPSATASVGQARWSAANVTSAA